VADPGTDIVFARASLDDRYRWARAIADAGDLVPKGFRDRNGAPNPAKVLLAAETGSMLQIHPIAALQGIHVIEGKPTISAGLMSALVRRAGHKLRVTTKGSVKDKTFEATAILIRADDPDFQYKSTWNWERAQRAGLTGKDVWQKYFEAMAKSRAISEVVKEGAEDVLMGNVYTAEELGAQVNETGEPVEDPNIVDAEIVPEETPSRPASSLGPGRGNLTDADRHAIADDWAARAARALSVTDARDLYREAKHRNLLDYPTSGGELLDDILRARGESLAADEDHATTVEPERTPDPIDEAPAELPW
jgi:hypothetical protein